MINITKPHYEKTDRTAKEVLLLSNIEANLAEIHRWLEELGYRPSGELDIVMPRLAFDSAPIIHWKDKWCIPHHS